MDDFATLKDLEARFRILDPQEAARAPQLLHDASVLMAVEMKRTGVEIDEEDELQADNLKRICCDIVRRAMCKGVDETTDTYAFGGNLVATASGDVYLTAAERRSLGAFGSGRVGFLSMV